MRFTRSLLLAVALGAVAVGCAGSRGHDPPGEVAPESPPPYTRKEISRLRKAEVAVGPFTTTTLRDPRRRHLAFEFEIRRDTLEIVPGSISLRPGGLPNYPGPTGPFTVTFRDKGSRVLIGYGMEDPRISRSCDTTQGGPGSVIVRSSGRVELLAPAVSTLWTMEVKYQDGRTQVFQLANEVDTLPPGSLPSP